MSTSSTESEFSNDVGWTWLIPPVSAKATSWSRNGVIGIVDQDKEGAYVVTIAWKPNAGTAYRAIVFDRIMNRYLATESRGGGGSEFQMMRYKFSLDTISFEDVSHIGMEMLTPDGWIIASQKAHKDAIEAGIEVIPLPQIGKPYNFNLTAIDGTLIKSDDLKGKVTLLDCWATWCLPCVKKMPKLQEAYSKWHSKGLEIIGINFDQELEKAQNAIQKEGLIWPQIYVPNDKEIRDSWFTVSSIRGLPRLLLIDANGILKLDTNNPDELFGNLSSLMQELNT